MMLCRFHFLKVTKEVESYHSGLSSDAYPGWLVAWVDVGGGCYRVVSEPGSTLGLNGLNVCWSCMHVSCMCVSYTYILVAFA